MSRHNCTYCECEDEKDDQIIRLADIIRSQSDNLSKIMSLLKVINDPVSEIDSKLGKNIDRLSAVVEQKSDLLQDIIRRVCDMWDARIKIIEDDLKKLSGSINK